MSLVKRYVSSEFYAKSDSLCHSHLFGNPDKFSIETDGGKMQFVILLSQYFIPKFCELHEDENVAAFGWNRGAIYA